MTAFNLEVDPKRIEAHENEEPPAYEPTDEDGIAIPTSSSNTEVTKGENNGFEGEVVEEDAEEERRAEASAIMSAENTKMKGASGDNSHWGSQNEPEVGAGFDNEMGGFPHEEGPSMDDFFHDDSYNDNDGEKEESLGKRVSEPVVTIKQDASELVSLVPKKKSSKSRRPKIRPSSKKKGK
ncbi:unnamed protein product [Pseudo-nitzschia multistriata]|uniref:Uncharacterized protein n=1 Tax=Pseudo-nitzschia multistriata TaxID=183589 RepID=A0A448ZAX5_9STRA|nr:unnamed protein product [Pseudo-nitzschia multistriata]